MDRAGTGAGRPALSSNRRFRLVRTAEAWTSATPGALNDGGIVHGEASLDAHAGRVFDHSALGRGVYTREGGVLLADRVVTALATAATRKGARLQPGSAVSDVDAERGLVRMANGASSRLMRWSLRLGPGRRSSFPDLSAS